MYANGFCPTAANGTNLACPNAYGALIGTAAVCSLLEIALSFRSPRILQKIFPPIVTGPTVMLIGVSLIEVGFQAWAGGSGPCNAMPKDGFFKLCPNIAAPRAMVWGSASFIGMCFMCDSISFIYKLETGLGFLVLISIIICERFGSPIMKSSSVIWGLLTGCIVAAACGYFDRSTVDYAPAVSFIWVQTLSLAFTDH